MGKVNEKCNSMKFVVLLKHTSQKPQYLREVQEILYTVSISGYVRGPDYVPALKL